MTCAGEVTTYTTDKSAPQGDYTLFSKNLQVFSLRRSLRLIIVLRCTV